MIFIRRTILLIVASVAGNSNSWGKKLKDTSHPECVILPKASLNSVREKDSVKIMNRILLGILSKNTYRLDRQGMNTDKHNETEPVLS